MPNSQKNTAAHWLARLDRDYPDVEALLRDDAEALTRYRAAITPPKHKHRDGSNITIKRGTSRAYTLDRLARTNPDLHRAGGEHGFPDVPILEQQPTEITVIFWNPGFNSIAIELIAATIAAKFTRPERGADGAFEHARTTPRIVAAGVSTRRIAAFVGIGETQVRRDSQVATAAHLADSRRFAKPKLI